MSEQGRDALRRWLWTLPHRLLLLCVVCAFPQAKNKQEKYDKISASKMQISVETLCKDAPAAFRIYLQYCRELRFTQKPDYKYLRSLFYDLFKYSGWKVRQRETTRNSALLSSRWLYMLTSFVLLCVCT